MYNSVMKFSYVILSYQFTLHVKEPFIIIQQSAAVKGSAVLMSEWHVNAYTL